MQPHTVLPWPSCCFPLSGSPPVASAVVASPSLVPPCYATAERPPSRPPFESGGLMSDATRLAPEMQRAAMKDISAEGLPSAIERQAAAGACLGLPPN